MVISVGHDVRFKRLVKRPNLLSTVGHLKGWIWQNIRKGLVCPACSQTVRMYRYSFNGSMAHNLTLIYLHNRSDYFHVERYLATLAHTGRYNGELRYWGMLEQKPNDDPTKRCSGLWRITEKGISFVEKSIKVPKYVWIYNKTSYGFDGPDIGIDEIKSTKFNYSELMSNDPD